ncbi:protein-glutamine gamma-glutamyltransferase [Metabacillus sp. GX 13764]|uniref:protein-glutamine gamma-glutamyltransferase n=1 Tax=Metabacillus kandeliae TaxID=2900151 RepID=UPI001E5FA2A1|nr:protein-glutamine gamma-glutamyltransferase [Metabacillus kandeliae]MCD7035776.1 protein-glutamine gamma-glutamyltransferase [Metabacillus kandeliae]
MILINRNLVGPEQMGGLAKTELQKEIFSKMNSYEEIYAYDNAEQLQFELQMRQRVVGAARDLNKSGVLFEIFQNSYANRKLWKVSSHGAFFLKPGVTPAEGIRDIFQNGSKYAFECATAMTIVLYKAALDSISEQQFNRLFDGLVLYDWHTDDDLGLYTTKGNNFVPGDVLYFNNPDFSPETPQWRGENVIDLGNGKYYGHGIGIDSAEGMIRQLNSYRKPYAIQSAYLFSQVSKPDYKYLSYFQNRDGNIVFLEDSRIVTKIGSHTWAI